jgi:hypothetical protein
VSYDPRGSLVKLLQKEVICGKTFKERSPPWLPSTSGLLDSSSDPKQCSFNICAAHDSRHGAWYDAVLSRLRSSLATSVVVGHTCGGHGLSGVGQTFLGCALLISCLSVTRWQNSRLPGLRAMLKSNTAYLYIICFPRVGDYKSHLPSHPIPPLISLHLLSP